MQNEEEHKLMAAMLRKPDGESGLKVADMMSDSNAKMIAASISLLDLAGAKRMLELGHATVRHLEDIYRIQPDIHYQGLEISELMISNAIAYKETHLMELADFALYDGFHIPFPNQHFDRVMTVNTIYFWQDPKNFIREIYRVMCDQGRLVICFRQKEFMTALPFTKFGFTLYNHHDMKELIESSSFKILNVHDETEVFTNKAGEISHRDFTGFVLEK